MQTRKQTRPAQAQKEQPKTISDFATVGDGELPNGRYKIKLTGMHNSEHFEFSLGFDNGKLSSTFMPLQNQDNACLENLLELFYGFLNQNSHAK